VSLVDPGTITESTYEFQVDLLDRTTQRVHFFWDLPPDVDPIPLISIFNQGVRADRFDWRWTQTGITHGSHTLTVVPVEETGNASVYRYTINADLCRVDINNDGQVNSQDFILYLSLWASSDPDADLNSDGIIDTLDFLVFLNEWVAGC